jgi:ABC-2 type transport system ATP-binding protein
MRPIPPELGEWSLELAADGDRAGLPLRRQRGAHGIPVAAAAAHRLGVGFKDLNTSQSSLEEIFVSLVRERA